MRLVTRTAFLVMVASVITSLACTSADTNCTCAVENNGQLRTLSCGETACISGTSVTCGNKDQSVYGGACTGNSNPPPPEFDAGAPSEPPPVPDHSCDDLLSFCNSSCTNPSSASADCQATASAGDPQACATWAFVNGVVCRP